MSVVLLGHACIGMTRACIDPHGYDAAKKIKGKKRHILVDTLGLLSTPSFIRPTFKIAMEAFSSWPPCLERFLF